VEGTPGKREREREIKRESVFCVLLSFLVFNKKERRRVFGPP
jgi:hypothetical protein